jgi:hypothetical protein
VAVGVDGWLIDQDNPIDVVWWCLKCIPGVEENMEQCMVCNDSSMCDTTMAGETTSARLTQ